MGFIAWIVFGLIVGLVARWLVPGESPGGIVGDVVVGVLGAVVGGWIYGLLGHTGISGFNLPSMVCALLGAIVLLWLLRAIGGRKAA
ncbi:MAG TPA: GlsB/YeaQ/YmgE family stress response membrane protein [Candidatus Binatia bacterium]|nr:GlsB/YeaQ/YmgE family stress response membrane protein [Candidatus Binatia bacterium]